MLANQYITPFWGIRCISKEGKRKGSFALNLRKKCFSLMKTVLFAHYHQYLKTDTNYTTFYSQLYKRVSLISVALCYSPKTICEISE